MFAMFVVMYMTQQRVTLIAASLQAQHSKTSLRIGYAQSVV